MNIANFPRKMPRGRFTLLQGKAVWVGLLFVTVTDYCHLLVRVCHPVSRSIRWWVFPSVCCPFYALVGPLFIDGVTHHWDVWLVELCVFCLLEITLVCLFCMSMLNFALCTFAPHTFREPMCETSLKRSWVWTWPAPTRVGRGATASFFTCFLVFLLLQSLLE